MCVCALPHLHSHGSQLFPPHSSQLHHRPVIGFCMDPYIYSPSPGEAHQHLPPTVLWGPHCGSCNLLCNLLHRNYMLYKPTYFKLYSWFTRSLPAGGLSSKANGDGMWAGQSKQCLPLGRELSLGSSRVLHAQGLMYANSVSLFLPQHLSRKWWWTVYSRASMASALAQPKANRHPAPSPMS